MYAPGQPNKPHNRFSADAGTGVDLAERNVGMHDMTAVKQKVNLSATELCAKGLAEAIKRWPFGNQTDLADLVGVNKTVISRWKKGFEKPKRPGPAMIAFCDVTGLDFWSLWEKNIRFTHEPKRLLVSDPKPIPTDPLDEKIAYLKRSTSSVMFRDVVERMYEREMESLLKSQ